MGDNWLPHPSSPSTATATTNTHIHLHQWWWRWHHYQQVKKVQETSEVDTSWPLVCFFLIPFFLFTNEIFRFYLQWQQPSTTASNSTCSLSLSPSSLPRRVNNNGMVPWQRHVNTSWPTFQHFRYHNGASTRNYHLTQGWGVAKAGQQGPHMHIEPQLGSLSFFSSFFTSTNDHFPHTVTTTNTWHPTTMNGAEMPLGLLVCGFFFFFPFSLLY
jgi:hypothetical protein